jgi:hypothetical protein
MHFLVAGIFVPRQQGATVRACEQAIQLWRGQSDRGTFRLTQCSWFIATPRHDSGVAASWAFVVAAPEVIIIEFPREKGFWLFRSRPERAAVGWSPETFNRWQKLLRTADVPYGRGASRVLQSSPSCELRQPRG